MKLIKFLIKWFRLEKQFVFVAMGDSTVEGIGATDKSKTVPALVFNSIKQTRNNAKFYNLGQAGAKMRDVLNSQLDEAVKLMPDLVTISVGANDILKIKATSPSEFENDLTKILATLKNKTNAKVYINNIPDPSFAPSIPGFLKLYFNFWIKNFNKKIAEQAAKTQSVLVDIYSYSKVFGKSYPELVSEDGLHPSDVGYALWAGAIITYIQKFSNSALLKKSLLS